MSRTRICIGLFLVLVTLAVYWQTGSHEFVNYDDNLYVTNNPQVKAGLSWDGVRWAFTTTHAANWHPLTWLSHMADVELYGLQPGGHHLTSVVLHALNGLLLFLFLSRATGAIWPSAFAAALFALHPLRVESVAWVAERKDVLSLLFGLLALLAYLRYVTRPAVSRYLLVGAMFALSLLAKPMLVTLPCVMLLLDYWPLNRLSTPVPGCGAVPKRFLGLSGWQALLVEKLPLVALTTAACVSTFYAQHSGASVAPIHAFPLLPRIGNAIIAYVRYLGKMVWPVDLAVFYPLPKVLPFWKWGGAALLLLAITGLVFVTARRRPYLVTGWFWFLGALVPVIGLVQVGMQAMADRYTYFAMIGIAIILAWGGDALTQRLPFRRPLLVAAATIALVGLTTLTWQQLAHWRNSYTLFSHATKVTDNNFIALGYLGIALTEQKRYQEATHYYSLSLTVNPWQDDMHHNLGLAFRELGEYTAAAEEFERALQIKPTLTDTRYELARYYAMNGQLADAISHLERVVKADPTHALGQYSLGVIYGRQGKSEQACRHFAEAVRLAPTHYEALSALAECRRRVK